MESEAMIVSFHYVLLYVYEKVESVQAKNSPPMLV